MEFYQLTRSKRKSLSIIIKKDGTVQVKAPTWLPKYQIDQFIQKKSDWIKEKRSQLSALERKSPPHTFQQGDVFYFLGEPYQLQFCQVPPTSHTPASEKVILNPKEKTLSAILDPSDTPSIKKHLEQWYVLQAKALFPQRVGIYYPLVAKAASEMAQKEISAVNRIAVRSQKTRWGSCSSKGNLNFNWHLVIAPLEILDYIVVHELCHLAYLNHSRQFWQLVEAILPDYPQRRNWLKVNGLLLDISFQNQ